MNILVVGTGSFGRLRGAAFARRGHAVAFASRDLERARAATRAVGGPVERASVVAGEVEDPLAPAALDWARAVFVATPPACHSAPTLQAALADKAVLVEKPVEATLERARALERRLDGRAVGVAENYRFLPQLPLVRAELPELGPLREARVVLLRPRAPRGWRIEPALSGGGVLADMGVHYIHLLRLLLGELTLDRAEERARVPGTEADAAFALFGRSAKDVRWCMELSWCSWRRASSVTLEGERGTLRFRAGRPALWRVGWFGLPFARRRVASGDEYGQEALHDAWLSSVERREPPPVPLAEGVRDLALVQEAYALARRVGRG